MKKISSLMSNSPLHNTEDNLANLNYTDTDFAENNIAVRGEAVIPGKEVEKIVKPGEPGYDEWLAAVTADPSIEDKYRDKKVVRERDYTAGLLEKYGRYYKEDQRGRKHVVHPIESGEYLSIAEAKKHFGGENTPGYIKWFENHPTAGWATAKPGYGVETNYDPEFKPSQRLSDYAYRIDE